MNGMFRLALTTCLAALLALGGVARAAGVSVAQDFKNLPAGTYKSFADTQGSSMSMDVTKDAYGRAVATFRYLQQQGGWCGEWIRTGNDWNGQDWSGAKGLLLTMSSGDAVEFQIQFNDAADNCYLSPVLDVAPGGWKSVTVPFSAFRLNSYYQPPKAQKGAPLDLTKILTFNIQPTTPGRHSFRVASVNLN